MKCPNCSYYGSSVWDTYHNENKPGKLRKRECLKCKKRFVTLELYVKQENIKKSYKNNIEQLNKDIKECINNFLEKSWGLDYEKQ